MPRHTREQATLLRAYAAATGISERTARHHRAHGDARWRDYLHRQGLRAAPSSGAGEPAPLQPSHPVRELTPLERARASANEAWRLLQRLQQAAERCDDPALLPVLARGVKDARAAWQQADAHAKAAAIDARALIPIERVRELQRELVPPLADALRGLKNNIASRLRPELRAPYYNAWAAEQANYDRTLQAIDARLESILEPC